MRQTLLISVISSLDEDEETKPEPKNLNDIKEEDEENPLSEESKNIQSEDSDSDNESKFPDTQIKIQHFEGTK